MLQMIQAECLVDSVSLQPCVLSAINGVVASEGADCMEFVQESNINRCLYHGIKCDESESRAISDEQAPALTC
jgi:hypothetical protein